MKEERLKSRELRSDRDSREAAKFSQFFREIEDMNKRLGSRDRKNFLNNEGTKYKLKAKVPMTETEE